MVVELVGAILSILGIPLLLTCLSGCLPSGLDRIFDYFGWMPPKDRKDPIQYEETLRDKRFSAIYRSHIAVLFPARVKLIEDIADSQLGTYRKSHRNIDRVWRSSEALIGLANNWPKDWQTVDATMIDELDESINKFAKSLNDSRHVKDAARADSHRLELYHRPLPVIAPIDDPGERYQLFDFDLCRLYSIADERSAGNDLEVFRATLPLCSIPRPNYTGFAMFFSGKYFYKNAREPAKVFVKLVVRPANLSEKELVDQLKSRQVSTPANHPPLLHYAVGATKVLLVFEWADGLDKVDGFYDDLPWTTDNGTIPAGGLSVPLVEIVANGVSPPVSSKRGGSSNPTRFDRSDDMLGSGSFKVVYKARDHEDCVDLAWCEVRVKDPSNERETERIHREMKILSELSHQNIISYVDSWMDGDRIILITELMSGTLRQHIKQMRKNGWTMSVSDVAKYSRQILSGLSYIHGRTTPIIHRDLKCDNIFIDSSSGKVKIGDFGVSRILEGTHAETLTGTRKFMAPEIYDKAYDEGVDVYSLGMCVLEMVTGEYPYRECENDIEVYKKVSQGILPESLATVTDHTVRHFIQRCLLPRDTRPSVKDLATHPLMLGDRLEVQADGTFIVTLNLTISGESQELVFQCDETEARLEDVARIRLAEFQLNTQDINAEGLADRIRAVLQLRSLPVVDPDWVEPILRFECSSDFWVRAVAFLSDGTMLAAAETVKLFDEGGKEKVFLPRNVSVSCIAVFQDKIIATSDNRGDISLWNVAVPLLMPISSFETCTAGVTSLTFSQDGKMLVSGSLDNKVRVWDVDSGKFRTLAGHTNNVNSVAISPDGKFIVSGSKDCTINVWDAESCSRVQTLKGHTGWVASVVFSPDSTLLASGSGDNTIRLWKKTVNNEGAETWECDGDLTGHDSVYCVAFSPTDGRVLASGSLDKTIKLWNTESRECYHTIKCDNMVFSLAFSPDGSTLLCGCVKTTILHRVPQLSS
ncbi:serine/threonine-protein kinase WNK4 [Carpediemonas membranifera]|uniref:Serine/threonine-protein kinase WNK4 n=1 Tax=Carpediemonas membranifera TaxID=201153 RepID=A0A8J6BVN1_9EUKA|nr:serine/threonine-protein kinase WNK4 [Carpediemonas membranifera]|eukprot:KAG9391581.1 serine/threonine-protein kinase WNK4 [Carpediemonas membranifera]